MPADRQRERPACRRRRDDLNASAIGKIGGKQRMLAADALMRERRNLARETGQHELGDRVILVPLDGAAERLDPDLARPIDVNVGDVGTRQCGFERRETRLEVDRDRGELARGCAHCAPAAELKSRSCATNTLMLLPAGTLSVGV